MKKLFAFLIIGIFLLTCVSAITWDNVNYYKLDETSGTVLDSTGVNDGTNIGATPNVAGKINTAYSFNGSYGYVNLSGGITGVTSRTVTAWIYPLNTSLGGIYGYGTLANGKDFQFVEAAAGELQVYGYSAPFSLMDSKIYVTLNSWQFVSVSYNGTTYTITKQNETGIYTNSSTGSITLNTTLTNNPKIGLYGAAYFNGSIDEVGVWNRSLNQTELIELYNNGTGISYPDIYPDITLNSPINNYNSTITSVTFNCSVVNSFGLTNVSLYLDGIINETNSSGINNTNYIFTKTLSQTTHNWTCESTSSMNGTTTASYRNLTIYKVLENNRTHNSSTYETARESYSINLSSNASLTAVDLFYNGSYYSTTKSGDIWTYTRDVPSSAVGVQNFSYRFTYAGEYINSTNSNQTVSAIIFGLCNATITDDFLNISFKDESNASAISAAISTSSFVYYLGSGTVNKTYTLINNTENANYTFCATPTDKTFHIDPYIQYVSTSYPQRIWNPDVTNYNSTATNQVLYLLESTDGLYVTFQVVNSADQILTGALIIATREIAGVETEVGRGTTGGDGTVTLWLNPDFNHKFTFSKDGFETYETSFAPTQSSYTITMSGGGTAVTDDYTRGILIYTYPIQNELFNDTSYDFEFNVTSSFWDLDSFGFSLRLANGTIVGSDSSTVSGTAASVTYDVNNQTIIYMDYYWIIDGNTTSSSKYWVITNTEYEGWSIKTFFTDLNTYLDSGLFGIDNFGRILIIFLILFTSVGIMSYKFGLVSPMSVTSMIFAIVFFMDVVVGLIPQIRGINYIVTYIAGLILILAAFNEVSR